MIKSIKTIALSGMLLQIFYDVFLINPELTKIIITGIKKAGNL